MNPMDLELAPAPGRYPLRISERWAVVVLVPVPGVVVLAFLVDGALFYLTDAPAALA